MTLWPRICGRRFQELFGQGSRAFLFFRFELLFLFRIRAPLGAPFFFAFCCCACACIHAVAAGRRRLDAADSRAIAKFFADFEEADFTGSAHMVPRKLLRVVADLDDSDMSLYLSPKNCGSRGSLNVRVGAFVPNHGRVLLDAFIDELSMSAICLP